MPNVCAYHRCLPSVPTCLCYLSMPTCLCLPSVPTICAYRLCLPSLPTCLCYCLCLPVCNLGERSARSKALPDLIDRLIVLIRLIDWFESFFIGVRWLYVWTVVVWGASLGGLNSIRFGDGLILRLWFDSIDRLNRSWCSLAGRSNGCSLDLATVVWFW